MARSHALHLKIEQELADALARLSSERDVSIAELVRRAIRRTYAAGIEGLSERKAAALVAWEAGFISLGKLAEELGMEVLALRTWLRDHGFEPAAAWHVSDADHV